jgi:hypothetical protein
MTLGHPPFGNQTVIFVTTTPGTVVGSLGEKTPGTIQVSVTGCRHRPLRDDETPEYLTDIATQVWKTTAPPVPAAINAAPDGQLIVNGITYKIVAGAQPFPDPQGVGIFKVTILSYIRYG